VSKALSRWLIYPCLIVAASNVFSTQVPREDIEAAILGSKSFPEVVLNGMDFNADSKVDVGDLIRLLKRTDVPIFLLSLRSFFNGLSGLFDQIDLGDRCSEFKPNRLS